MTINKFNDFLSMKNSYSSNKNNNDVIKKLDEMRTILSKSKRKPTEKEKIKSVERSI